MFDLEERFMRIRDYEFLIIDLLLDREYYSVVDLFELAEVQCEEDKFNLICALDSLWTRGILQREVFEDNLGLFKLLF
jgi:hypothetical protein